MSLYHEVFAGESFSEDNYFEAVRYVLGPEYANLNESELEDVLLSRVDQMSESEAEGFWSSLGNVASSIGSGVLRGVSAVAPIVGTAVGTYFGAPQIGGAVGGLVSNLAGAGSAALDNSRQQQRRQGPPQQQRRPANNNRRRQAPSPLGQAWGNTTRYLADAGRAALPAIQQYVQDNPVQLRPQAAQDIARVQGLYNQLGGVINNPQFQAGQAQQSLGTASPNAPIESHSFAELIETVNYLTENILYEYYNGGLIPTEDYYVDQYGQFVGSNTPNRINRIENSIASL
ncbi:MULTISPECIES: hypothetical protein [Flavobacterium]|uniref:Uncharacterized protein n=2 Tax=Flavobacterium TaxID=237 RepID=A0A6V6ZAB0_9FLAO|nr:MULTISPECIES: hypothetical protein [Flavobacterium]OOV19354.1 hypothetical protein BXU10_06725 [Flavobacterium sp. LM4]CAD0005420.1 hypothetical protein FLAT13_02742 [Flavobacterium salmonis]CAD0008680.1 hypothetical protein FLACHUCJ7_03903 [Flavobacterium chungangense]